MSLKEDLESQTVAQLKQLCKARNVKGYSKLSKDELIQAILAKACEPSQSSAVEDPATQQMLQRTNTKKLYSRDESEKRIQENPALAQKQADFAGGAREKIKALEDSSQKSTQKGKKSGGKKKKELDTSEKPVDTTDLVSRLSQPQGSGSQPEQKTTTAVPLFPVKSPSIAQENESAKELASRLSQPKDTAKKPKANAAQVAPTSSLKSSSSPQIHEPVKKFESKKHTQDGKESLLQETPLITETKPVIKKSGGKKKKSNASAQQLEVKEPARIKQETKRPSSTSKDKAHRAKIGSYVPPVVKPSTSAQKPQGKKPSTQIARAPTKKPSSQTTQEPVKKPSSHPATQEVKEPRLQELPAGEQAIAFKKLSKNVMPILKAHKQDFMRKSTKDLEKLLEILENEKNRLTVYQLTDKMLRNFIDESIKLINDAKEEQYNRMEQEYCVKILPGILKKNEKDIKKIVSQIGPYFSEKDAAKQIVEKIIKNKSPFPPAYLVTVILKKIHDKSVAYTPSKN